jgi:hypothetical protein
MAWSPSETVRRPWLVCTGCCIVWAVTRQPELLASLQVWPLVVLAVVGVPATVFLNAAAYQISARLWGRRESLPMALRVTVAGTIANLAPVPGAALVRVAALRAVGMSWRESAAATSAVSLVWVAVSLFYSAAWLIVFDRQAFSVAASLGGIVTVMLAIRFTPVGRRYLLAVTTLISVGLVLVDVVRLYLAFHSLSINADFGAVSTLVAASALSSLAGIFPAGVGLREYLSAAMSPLVGLPVEATIIAAAINRLLGLAVLVILFPGIVRWRASV